MSVFVCYFIIASSAYIVESSGIPDDLYLLLPFIQSQPLPSCQPNELYKSCFGNCSDCTERGKCVITTCLEGCDCAPHFFRITPNGPCVPVAKCPVPECGENEVFRECGPICERCRTIKCQVISCDHRCYCKEGHLRNEDGICIPEEECPKRVRCSRAEEWSDTGLANEFCLHSENWTSVSEIQEISQCYCKEGHKRNSLGHCIDEARCPRIKCPGKEVFYDCIPKCNVTCRNRGQPDCVEDDNCYPGCFCPSGYFMNDFRQCVSIEECPTDIMHILVFEPTETPGSSKPPDNQNTTIVESSDEEDSETDSEFVTEAIKVDDTEKDVKEYEVVDTKNSSTELTSELSVFNETSSSSPMKTSTVDSFDASSEPLNAQNITEANCTSTEFTVDDDFEFDNEDL